jgi:tetratricopeptide (TPR) repeat protein
LRLENRVVDAESAYAEALRSARQTHEDDPAMAVVLHNTAFFHHQAGRVGEAERLYLQAYRWFAAHQPEHLPSLVRVVTNLGVVYAETGRWAKAEAQIRPWLDAVPSRAGDAARLHGVFASVLARQGKFTEAEPLMAATRAAIEREPVSLLQQESLAQTLSNQAALYRATGRVTEATGNYQAALAILSSLTRPLPIVLVRTLHEAALVQTDAVALAYYQRALKLADARLEAGHPLIATVCHGYANLLRKLHRAGEAKKLERRAQAIEDRYQHENLLGHTVDAHSFR